MIKESKDSVIRARCTAELKTRVVSFAERFGIEEADVLRLALDDYIARNEKADALEFKRPAISRAPTQESKGQALGAAVDLAKSRKRAANPKP